MLEINVVAHGWYSLIKKPKDFVLGIMGTALHTLNIAHYKPNISIALANDFFIRQLNLKFRKIDASTNVLSFPCEHLSYKCDLGDIAISIDTIKKESYEYNIPIFEHIAHMLIHGLLHLLGYDHTTRKEEIIMKDLEHKILIVLDSYL
ncbi:rRNA maturation RNase YbeY [Wolbachia pipientis]|uniref:Endoribonuclease YbeY n=1 Tax=Wolbachia pipientis TaxID=955 RepID=A0A1E7QJU5_WOLPI|nr:rRNA maturation RNase YbeY [Wolbachia pipientis]OEY86484.1 rRNA maturation RNase YbeY [Wolbachia pipientis]